MIETYTELLAHMRTEHQPPIWVLAECAPAVLTEVHRLDHQTERPESMAPLAHVHD